MPKRLIPDDPEGRFIFAAIMLCVVLVLVLVYVLTMIPRAAVGADMKVRTSATVDAINYGRWKVMCKGPARYEAMREAYELRKPDPCNGAKQWVR